MSFDIDIDMATRKFSLTITGDLPRTANEQVAAKMEALHYALRQIETAKKPIGTSQQALVDSLGRSTPALLEKVADVTRVEKGRKAAALHDAIRSVETLDLDKDDEIIDQATAGILETIAAVTKADEDITPALEVLSLSAEAIKAEIETHHKVKAVADTEKEIRDSADQLKANIDRERDEKLAAIPKIKK